MKKLILASTSPRRKEILAQSGLEFDVEPSAYEEDMTLDLTPVELAKHLSQGKAEDVATKHKGEPVVVIGADTFVAYAGKVIGKPHTAEKAKLSLHELSGQFHSLITGFTIIDCQSGRSSTNTVETKVHFRDLTDTEIDSYVATGEPLDKGGGYAIQGRAGTFIDRIEGDYYNVVGLPLSAVVVALKEFGIELG